MKNFIFISPHFPETYYRFVEGLVNNGFNVFGIGDAPYNELPQRLKELLTEYYMCNDMDNFENEIRAVGYFQDKYGHIDYLESNNEYWLAKDAKLREIFNITTGVIGDEIQVFQSKSKMKERYIKAGVKVARYILVDTLDNLIKFAEEVGYPIFAKPDTGVGAAGDYKINNIEDLHDFYNEKPQNITYICEQFVTGNIVSFDGVCDSNSEVIFATSECFPPSIADVLKQKLEVFYYCLPSVPKDLDDIGRRVIRAFEVKNRFFHLEFFRLTKKVKGLGDIGDIVGLETNMRAPGGYTPDLINFANSVNCYQIWADSMAFDQNRQYMNYEKFYACCASRRDCYDYFYSNEEVINTFKNNICASGRYPQILADCMGDSFYMAKFKSVEEVELFHAYANRRVGDKIKTPKTNNKKHTGPICDTHIDGA